MFTRQSFIYWNAHCKKNWINVSFCETGQLPLPLLNVNICFSLGAKCWVQGGVGGQFPRNLLKLIRKIVMKKGSIEVTL